MKVLGLTGGIGMGKSTVVQLLRQRGVPVVDTDELAHELVRPGQPALAEIVAAFGRNIAGEDGQLRREALADIVFADPEARVRLESILHPRIREHWLTQAEKWRQQDRALGVVVVPLLFETQAEMEFDEVVCVACTAATQQQRLRARGWTEAQIRQRVAAQWSSERKMTAADCVVWTEGGMDVLSAQLDRILSRC
jgi:dephospho-CoA kinase